MKRGRPLRVGLAGAGWVTQYHLESWAQLADRARVVAIADPDVAAARQRADIFGIPAVYDSVEAMLQSEPLDAVDVAAPREAHAPICRAAARQQLAILCQKPLAPTLAEAEALVSDVGREGVRLMVHENWRFRPHYRRIAEWLRAGHAGEIRTVTMSLLTSGLVPDPDGTLPALVRQPMLATLDRFLLMEVLIHLVDTLRFLLGPLSLVGTRLGRSCPAVRGEDRAALFLSTLDGAAVSLIGDFMARDHPPAQYDRLEIVGTHGEIILERDRLRLTADVPARASAARERVGESEGGRPSVKEDRPLDLAANYRASYAAAIAHFVDRLADDGPFETGPDDNLETLRIVEAAYAAAQWRA
jgi:predicted dehydrogenase